MSEERKQRLETWRRLEATVGEYNNLLQLLAKERDEFGDKECKLLTKVRHVTELLELEKMESYAWKAKAEALAGALEKIAIGNNRERSIGMDTPPIAVSRDQLRLWAQAALAAFKEPKA